MISKIVFAKRKSIVKFSSQSQHLRDMEQITVCYMKVTWHLFTQPKMPVIVLNPLLFSIVNQKTAAHVTIYFRSLCLCWSKIDGYVASASLLVLISESTKPKIQGKKYDLSPKWCEVKCCVLVLPLHPCSYLRKQVAAALLKRGVSPAKETASQTES